MKVTVKRPHTLDETYAGVAGELRVAAELVRCGMRVAKPYWTNDEADLVVLYGTRGRNIPTSRRSRKTLVPVHLQVKAVQFLPSKSRAAETSRRVKIKKRYVEDTRSLCIAIYRVDKDCLWFVDGPKNIIRAYNDQPGRRKKYAELPNAAELSFTITATEGTKGPSLKDWLVPRDDRQWLPTRIERVVDNLTANEIDRILQEFERSGTVW